MTDKALEAALKACPFCNASGDELMMFCDPEEGRDNSGPSRRIQCAMCHVEAPFYDTEAEAIAAWNRRASVSALPGEAEVVGLVERLRKGPIAYQSPSGPIFAGPDTLHREAAASLQAMQARAEKAERERDEALEQRNLTLTEMAGQTSRAEAAEARVKELEEAGQKDFRTGYLLAVANIVHTHDEPTIAEDVLMESGITSDALQEHEYCDFDLSVLRSLFTSIEARTALKGGSNG